MHIAHYFGVSRLAALLRLRNLKVVTQTEFEELKAADDAGLGSELARLFNLPDSQNKEERDGFRRRVLGLTMEAYRRELITRAKFAEISALLSMQDKEINRLLDKSGLNGGDDSPAEVNSK